MEVAAHSEPRLSFQGARHIHVFSQMKAKTQQQHDSSILAGADASCRRDLRDLRLQCQRLSNSNLELKSAADAGRAEASVSRRSADAARKELEAERRNGAELRRVRKSLQEAVAVDKKTIASLQAQMSKGAPSSRLLERARCLKHTADTLKKKLNDEARALSAKTADLEIARRDLRALTIALDVKAEGLPTGGTQRSVTAGELLEVGRARLTNHDLALELAYMSETSGRLASDKEELEKRLSQEADKVKIYQAEIAALQGALDQQQKATDAHRVELSKENTSTSREARELVEALRSREKELLGNVDTAKSHCESLEGELVALSEVAERGEATGAKLEKMQEDLNVCEAALAAENDRNKQISANLRASEEKTRILRQGLEVLEGAEREGRRLAGLLEEGETLQNALRGDATVAREELRDALDERAELVRGLRQARVFNDELAKAKEKAEEREREACARCTDVKEGKLALQRALLEQLSVARAGLREERERREEVEAALSTLTGAAAATSNNRMRSHSGKLVDSDEDDTTFSQGDDPATPTSRNIRPRDTLVQDYLGREGAEQFLSDWDEERSSSSLSLSSSPPSSVRSLSPVPLPPAMAFTANGKSNGADATRYVQGPTPIEQPTPPPPPKAIADSMDENSRGNSAAHTHTQDVRDSAGSGGGGGDPAAAATITGRWDIPTREGRVPPSVPTGDVLATGDVPGAGAKSVTLGKVLGDTSSSVMLAPRKIYIAVQTSKLRKPSCGRRPCSVNKSGDDAGVSTAVPAAQDHPEACDASSARHPPKSSADGVVSKTVSRRRVPVVHKKSGDGNAEVSTDHVPRAAANPSSKTLEIRFQSEGGDTIDVIDDRASRNGHCSNSGGVVFRESDTVGTSNRGGGVAIRESGTVGVGVGGNGCAAAVEGVDGGKGDVGEAVVSAPPAVGRRRKLPRSSLLDLAYQSIDDI